MVPGTIYSVRRATPVELAGQRGEDGEQHSDQSTDATTGCCIGQASMVADGLGLWNSGRAAAVTALTGFQLAIVCRIGGMWAVGTSALETNAIGNRITSPIPCADSGLLLTMPTQAQAHESA